MFTLTFVATGAVPFLFQAEIEQASENAKEHAWGVQKIGEKWGGGEQEWGEGVVSLFFALPPTFVPLIRVSFLETPATQTIFTYVQFVAT